MDYMDPDVLCPQKADKFIISLSMNYVKTNLNSIYLN